jgi:pimeloyl-ACP methyl ester carboxylesterase
LVGPGSWSVGEEFAYQKQTMRNVMAKNWAANGDFKPNEIDEILHLMDLVYSAPASNVFEAVQEFHKQAKTKSWYPKFRTAFPPPPETPGELNDCKLWSQEAFGFDAVKEYSGIPCPTLILFGENDECVNPKVCIPNIQAGFAKSGNSRLTVKVYPGAGHVLNGAGNQPEKDVEEWLVQNSR